ncbi:glutathione S-transferase LANCL1-like isoform X2 [Amphibalanus amphitrite]|uniref:glutathione S-transferase LANCL1-like isoform X2 n=1 Tax=Amphibalanus amphitrite TaxID=1232801 RepID=UPI001C9162A0|nr:glutathione S-transferase LANCL1-like isoform X2 [Amphibalanus amphitrite]
MSAESREFKNSYEDWESNPASKLHKKLDMMQYSEAGGLWKLGPEFQHTLQQWQQHLLERLERSLPSSPDEGDSSVYTGTAGIALMYLHLHSISGDQHLLQSAAGLVKKLERASAGAAGRTRRVSLHCGEAGALAVTAALEHRMGRTDRAADYAQRVLSMVGTVQTSRSMPDELLYGRSGYLAALLYLHSQLGEHAPAGLTDAMQKVPELVGQSALSDLVRPTVDYLVSLRLASGNYPSSLESVLSDRLVHWCHGAPGFSHMLCLAYKVFGDDRYLQLAQEAAEVVWRRGLLKKGYGLCHGAAGNAYTFLHVYQLTKAWPAPCAFWPTCSGRTLSASPPSASEERLLRTEERAAAVDKPSGHRYRHSAQQLIFHRLPPSAAYRSEPLCMRKRSGSAQRKPMHCTDTDDVSTPGP